MRLMTRIFSLLLICLALNGCISEATSVPTLNTSPSATQARPILPTAAQVGTSTALAFTPTPRAEPSATPTPQPTATPTTAPNPITPAAAPVLFSYPIGTPGKPLGDGFFIRHGAGVENTWYNPGYWHTGEDWYAIAGDTAGAQV